MREISRAYIEETGNEGKPGPQPLQHEDMNQPFQTVQCTPSIPHPLCISFSATNLNWGRPNGLGSLRELGPQDCVPDTLDNGRRREKRHRRREYAIHPKV